MTTQITVRIPDDLAEFVDAHADNRTVFVVRALEHERRRLLAESDAAIYAAQRDEIDAEFGGLATYAARTSPDLE